MNEFLKAFAEQFDDTDIHEISANTNFRELEEWSSLTALSVIALVKTKYGKKITGREIRGCNTVNDLFELISSK